MNTGVRDNDEKCYSCERRVLRQTLLERKLQLMYWLIFAFSGIMSEMLKHYSWGDRGKASVEKESKKLRIKHGKL